MIIYVRLIKPSNGSVTSYNDIFTNILQAQNVTPNKIKTLVRKMFTETGIMLDKESRIDCELVILSKLTEYFFIEGYNKNLNDIKLSSEKMNKSDFINQNLFLYEDVYDNMMISYSSFKEKFYWNFGEIIQVVYQKYPKMFKKTIMRHLLNQPNNQSLKYQLIQYYYSNKEYRKTKILIKVKLLTNIFF